MRWGGRQVFPPCPVFHPRPPFHVYGGRSITDAGGAAGVWSCYLITCAATLCTSPMSRPSTYCIRFAPYLPRSRPQTSAVLVCLVLGAFFRSSAAVRCSHSCRAMLDSHQHGAACRLYPPPLSCIHFRCTLSYIDFTRDSGDNALFILVGGCKMGGHVW